VNLFRTVTIGDNAQRIAEAVQDSMRRADIVITTGVIVGGLVIMTADRLFLPALKDFLKGLMDFTVLPSLASNPTMQTVVAQNANPILYRFLLFGLTLVIMMAVRPEGLIPSAQMRAELHKDEEVAIDIEENNKTKAKKG